MMTKTLRSLFTAIFFLYPLLVFLALKAFDVRLASLVLSAILLLRWVLFKRTSEQTFGKMFEVVLWIVLVNNVLNLYFKSEFILKMYPVLMSAGVAGIFIRSLCLKQPVIEKFARLHEKELSPEKLEYIRKLTVVWSIWLSINTILALYTALFSHFENWVLYNNVVFYLVSGCLVLVDISYRRFKHAKA